MTAGMVYLVGADPDDPELVAVKAQRLLASCDAVVYDEPVPHELITALPESAEKHYVGEAKAGVRR